MDLIQIAKTQEEYLQKIRHELHRVPELRFETKKTRKIILREIQAISDSIPYNKGVLMQVTEKNGGIWADMTFNFSDDCLTIGLRADFDALAVNEKTDLDFISTHPGQMHACGHDIHTAWLLATMRAIVTGDVKPTCNIRFIFEDGEENPITPPGSALLIKDGVLNEVDQIYGLHIWAHPDRQVGTFYSRHGALLGNSGRLGIYLSCKGGHVAEPHLGVNGLRIQHEISTALFNLPSRVLDPTEPYILEPASCDAGKPGGKSSNIMAATVESWWGVRTMLPRPQHENYLDQVKKEIGSVVSRYPGATVTFETIAGHPATINNSSAVVFVSDQLSKSGQITYIQHPPLLGGESFAYYLEKVPGAIWMLGAHQPETGFHHEPNFNPNPSVFWKGVLFFLAIATAERN